MTLCPEFQEVPVCLAIPGRIVEFPSNTAHFAVVEVAKVRRKVNVDLLREDGLAIGDWVLIHVGFAMSKIGVAEAEEQMRVLAMLREAQQAMDELEGYRFG